MAKTIAEYGRGETIFTQGDACEDVLYIQTGGVKLSVLSKTGREAVVAMLGPGDFFGEGCLAGQPVRMGSATAITPSVILFVGKEKGFGGGPRSKGNPIIFPQKNPKQKNKKKKKRRTTL